MEIVHQLLWFLKPEGIQWLIQTGGLPVICLIIFAETGFFALLPGDSLLVQCGIFAATPGADGQPLLPLWALLVIVPVLAEEHPELWGGLVDLGAAEMPADEAGALVAHLSAPGREEQVALRAVRRFAARIVTVDIDESPGRSKWRADAAYLVTGGLGGVGLQVAKAMAAQGARRLVLLGRTPLPARNTWAGIDPASRAGERVAGVRALEAAGVAVHLASVDLGDTAELQSFLEAYAAEGWPPIRGVVHAAAALDNYLARDMDAAAFDAVMASKLRSAQWLDRLLPDLDLFVLFSSIVGTIGQSGEANLKNVWLGQKKRNKRNQYCCFKTKYSRHN